MTGRDDMNPGLKLTAYGLVLAVMLGVGAIVGNAVGPIDVGGEPTGTMNHEAPQ